MLMFVTPYNVQKMFKLIVLNVILEVGNSSSVQMVPAVAALIKIHQLMKYQMKILYTKELHHMLLIL